MAEIKRQMTRHLRSAKQWLTRAEESFDKNSNIRGELDLFLAQAELQHARETNCSRRWRYRYMAIRHGLACVAATAVVAIGFGAYWWSGERSIEPVRPIVQQAEPAPVVNIIPETKSVAPLLEAGPRPETSLAASAAAASQPAIPAQTGRKEQIEPSRQAEQKPLLSPNEIQQIVRTAEKSLRSQ